MALSSSLSRSLVAASAALVLSLALAVSAHDGELKATTATTGAPPCDVAAIDLSEYAQWAHEEGYWLGEYSLYDADGSPRQSGSDWNYPYAHYRGFITGNVEGSAYRQRNVFMYPPADADGCVDSSVVGAGVCGRNGNTKIFEADQAATTCDPARPGRIAGRRGLIRLEDLRVPVAAAHAGADDRRVHAPVGVSRRVHEHVPLPVGAALDVPRNEAAVVRVRVVPVRTGLARRAVGVVERVLAEPVPLLVRPLRVLAEVDGRDVARRCARRRGRRLQLAIVGADRQREREHKRRGRRDERTREGGGERHREGAWRRVRRATGLSSAALLPSLLCILVVRLTALILTSTD